MVRKQPHPPLPRRNIYSWGNVEQGDGSSLPTREATDYPMSMQAPNLGRRSSASNNNNNNNNNKVLLNSVALWFVLSLSLSLLAP